MGAKARGTGFIVRVESGAIDILTALHVVADLAASRASRTPVWHEVSAQVQLGSGEIITVPLGTQGSRSSIDQDWALLRFEGALPSPVVPLRLAGLESRPHARKWQTFGYSDAAPDAGEPHSGDIEDERGNVIYLFDKQGASGTGGFLSGCSGAPCIVEGHVVGIIVEALQRKEKERKAQSIHGAVFALRIEAVAVECGLKDRAARPT
ncbi:trypsin-like peptidase domain-containing protein [Stigmatella aurantiaca]|uniref:trypsin-like peptidase domain-containing protein n=1 Tax=Stigmatella aurantiaca TaxID=41 RepID=UPI002FC3991A